MQYLTSLHPSHLAPADRLEVGHFGLLGRRRHNSAVWKGDKANAIQGWTPFYETFVVKMMFF